MRRFNREWLGATPTARAEVRLGLESLDERCVPAVYLEIGGTLRIDGSPGSDWYVVSETPYGLDVMTIRAGILTGNTFESSAVSRVVFYGGAGDDELDCRTLARPVTAYGGSGKDTLLGGTVSNLLLGEGESDSLNCRSTDAIAISGDHETPGGNWGQTYADGGAGDDLIRGSRWRDTLIGGPDHDTLAGYDGEDTLDGGSGNDFLYGGLARDTLQGGTGRDSLIGGYGLDFLDGGPDLDWDVLIGGLNSNSNLIDPYGSDTFVKYRYTGMSPAPGQADEFRDRAPDDVMVEQTLFIPWTQPTSVSVSISPTEIGTEPFDYTTSGEDRWNWSG